ncbi:hypothetical protein [Streptomyces sp. H27-S2]|uniref:hypothetical protein n=1 Tax=Streptomyces antarcticus TaxID=2996458 RepID=UPI002270EA8D|nr:hypothetical protein [Streptomyces sp. H27-S2]MCY0950623.1 hypothetical protein [Streptomyces sp. H27-S2]
MDLRQALKEVVTWFNDESRSFVRCSRIGMNAEYGKNDPDAAPWASMVSRSRL